MVMVVSTAGLTGRGRVESLNVGSNGDGMYGWLNASDVPERKEAEHKAKKKVWNKLAKERRRGKK